MPDLGTVSQTCEPLGDCATLLGKSKHELNGGNACLVKMVNLHSKSLRHF